MAEPVRSASTAAANADDDTAPEASRLPTNAEDRKAAAALDSLNANEISAQATEGAGGKQPSAADQAALGAAMSRLEIASGVRKKAAESKKVEESEKKGEAVEVKKKIKVASEDVAFLVEELELSKVKATELLRSHDGDPVKAAKAFIAPPPSSVAV